MNGGVLVLPTQTAPDFRNCSATNESSFATRSLIAGEPVAHVIPAYFMLSFRVYGMPSSGPRSLPALRRPSLAAASWNDRGLSIGMALRQGPRQSYVKILMRYFAVSSTLVIDPLESASCSSAMLAPTRFCVNVRYGANNLQRRPVPVTFSLRPSYNWCGGFYTRISTLGKSCRTTYAVKLQCAT